MAEFFHMNGYGGYIWASFGIVILGLAILAFQSRQQFKKLAAEAELLKTQNPRNQTENGA